MPAQHTSTLIDPASVAAYQAAHFKVQAAGGFTLLLDKPNPELAHLFIKDVVTSAAYITAYNPLGETVAAPVNKAAQAALETDLRTLQLKSYPGQGEDPNGIWPAEVSVLAMGLTLDKAQALGMKYNQNAIVWIGIDAVPRLLLLR